MVVRLSDSQIAAFENAGISQDQIGSMIANARSKGIGDDVIYNDLSNKASVYANYAGLQIKEMDRQIDDQQRDNLVASAEKLIEAQEAKKKAEMAKQPIEGALMKDLRENGPDGAFFNAKVPNVEGTNNAAYAAQQAAYQAGKDMNALEAFIVHTGDNIMVSTEDFVMPDAEMKRAGAAESHPWASLGGVITGNVLGIGGKLTGAAIKGIEKLSARSAEKAAEKGAKQTLGKRLLRFGAKTAVDAGVGTLMLATKDAVQAASKNEEWRTFRIDSRRYADDFIDGMGWSAAFGSAGSFIGRWRRGAKNAANRFGGIEKIKVLQKEHQKRLDAGMDPIEAQHWFQHELIATLPEEEQKAVAYAMRYDPAFRQYFNDIATTMKTDIDRSALLITKREIKKATDDSMSALKRNQNLGSTDFDTSKAGLVDALGTSSAKNREVGKKLTEEGNIILTQDPDIYSKFKEQTRQAAQMGDSTVYNKLIEGAEVFDFEQVKQQAQVMGLDLNSPEAKKLAQEHAKKLLDQGADSVSDVHETIGLIDRLGNNGDIKAGKGTAVGGFREGLNNTLETAFGDPSNPATLSGKFRGYHNVKHFEDVMTEAHDFGRNLDPINQAEELSNFLTSHGNAGADEAIAITTAVKMGYLDKLKNLAKEGKDVEWKNAVNAANKNPQLRSMLGGEKGVQEYMKAMEPEVRAAKSLKNILVSSTPGAKADTSMQDLIGGIVAAGTNSPLGFWGRVQRLLQQYAPDGVTPRVGEQMKQIMEDPTWNNVNKFINWAAKDPTTRVQLERAVDAWFHEVAQGTNMAWKEVGRYGAQNTPAFTGGQ